MVGIDKIDKLGTDKIDKNEWHDYSSFPILSFLVDAYPLLDGNDTPDWTYQLSNFYVF